MKWQPIETAPHNTEVLAYDPEDYGILVSKSGNDWQGNEVWAGGSYASPPFEPTHWMPLPDPPARTHRMTEEEKAILTAFKAGESAYEIAVHLGINQERVNEIIRDALKRQAMP